MQGTWSAVGRGYCRSITVRVERVRAPVSVPTSVSLVRTVVVLPSDTSVPPPA